MKTPIFLAAAAALATAHGAQAAPLESTSATTSYHRVEVEGVGIFYREAGPNDAPTIVLLRLPILLAGIRYAHSFAGDALPPDRTRLPRLRPE